MKNKLAVIIPTIFVVVLAAACAFFILRPTSFRLDEEYYSEDMIQPISATDLQRLIDKKSSFAVFVSQPACRTSDDLKKHIQSFTAEHSLKFYEIAFSELKTLPVADAVRFYPSFLIFEKGKLVDFLEADSDEDAPAYTSLDGFQAWFTKRVAL